MCYSVKIGIPYHVVHIIKTVFPFQTSQGQPRGARFENNYVITVHAGAGADLSNSCNTIGPCFNQVILTNDPGESNHPDADPLPLVDHLHTDPDPTEIFDCSKCEARFFDKLQLVHHFRYEHCGKSPRTKSKTTDHHHHSAQGTSQHFELNNHNVEEQLNNTVNTFADISRQTQSFVSQNNESDKSLDSVNKMINSNVGNCENIGRLLDADDSKDNITLMTSEACQSIDIQNRDTEKEEQRHVDHERPETCKSLSNRQDKGVDLGRRINLKPCTVAINKIDLDFNPKGHRKRSHDLSNDAKNNKRKPDNVNETMESEGTFNGAKVNLFRKAIQRSGDASSPMTFGDQSEKNPRGLKTRRFSVKSRTHCDIDSRSFEINNKRSCHDKENRDKSACVERHDMQDKTSQSTGKRLLDVTNKSVNFAGKNDKRCRTKLPDTGSAKSSTVVSTPEIEDVERKPRLPLITTKWPQLKLAPLSVKDVTLEETILAPRSEFVNSPWTDQMKVESGEDDKEFQSTFSNQNDQTNVGTSRVVHSNLQTLLKSLTEKAKTTKGSIKCGVCYKEFEESNQLFVHFEINHCIAGKRLGNRSSEDCIVIE